MRSAVPLRAWPAAFGGAGPLPPEPCFALPLASKAVPVKHRPVDRRCFQAVFGPSFASFACLRRWAFASGIHCAPAGTSNADPGALPASPPDTRDPRRPQLSRRATVIATCPRNDHRASMKILRFPANPQCSGANAANSAGGAAVAAPRRQSERPDLPDGRPGRCCGAGPVRPVRLVPVGPVGPVGSERWKEGGARRGLDVRELRARSRLHDPQPVRRHVDHGQIGHDPVDNSTAGGGK